MPRACAARVTLWADALSAWSTALAFDDVQRQHLRRRVRFLRDVTFRACRTQMQGQTGCLNGAGGLHQCGTFDHSAQLAYVAGPVVRQQPAYDARRNPLHRFGVALGVLRQEVVDELRNVLAPLAKRGYYDRKRRQAVVQILAEFARSHRRLQIPVGGRDHLQVHRDRGRAADPLQLALLQDPQQLGLQCRRHVGDLVQQDRTAVRAFEVPDSAARRTGERPLLVPEQLALDQSLGHCCAVDCHEWPLAACAAEVQGLGYQLLAGTALAADKHRDVGLHCPLHQRVYPLHRRARAHDALE